MFQKKIAFIVSTYGHYWWRQCVTAKRPYISSRVMASHFRSQ